MRRLFTSESVTEGHPDKLCDQVSDAVLDAILAEDPDARVACETFATTGMITVMGEITTSTYVDINAIVRKKSTVFCQSRSNHMGESSGLQITIISCFSNWWMR